MTTRTLRRRFFSIVGRLYTLGTPSHSASSAGVALGNTVRPRTGQTANHSVIELTAAMAHRTPHNLSHPQTRAGQRVSPAAHRFVNFTHNRHCGPPQAFNITTGNLQNAPAPASYPHRHLAASFTYAPAEIPRLFGGFGFSHRPRSVLSWLPLWSWQRIGRTERRFPTPLYKESHCVRNG